MKKKLLSLLLVSAMAATTFVGCGSNAEETTDAATDSAEATTEDPIANLIAATDGTVELNLWCSEMEAYQTVMAQLVDEFKTQYPDVDFNITIGQVSEADAKDKVLEDVEAAADVYVFADDQLAELCKAGALQEVSATYTYDPAETNSASTVTAATYDGKLMAYPLTASNGYFLYYNSEYLSADDVASWDTILEKANEAGKKVGMEVPNGWYIYSFFAGAGCTLTMNDDGSNTCDWNSETGVKVAEGISKIVTDPAFTYVGNDDAMSMLPDGDLIAYVSGTWNADTINGVYGDGYAAAKLPTFDCGGEQVQMGSYAGYKLVGVNPYSKNVGWSMLLAEYLTSESSQLAIGNATGEGPANTVAASQIDSPALQALAAQSEFADQQVVGGKFWDPAASLGQNLCDGATNYQELLDTAVEGITQPAE